MPVFSETQLQLFGAEIGAFSIVTKREATGDKSITFDEAEKRIIMQKYPLDSFARMGAGPQDSHSAPRWFNVYDIATGRTIAWKLPINYPKVRGFELRLYFQKGSGFYPTTGSVWFIFVRADEDYPFIGWAEPDVWANFFNIASFARHFIADYAMDEDDEEYQKAISSPQARSDSQEYLVTRYDRNAALARGLAEKVGFRCQINSEHETFISASSGEQYVEAHHLVLVSRSDEFSTSLDVEANIVILCPNCHRAVHFGNSDTKSALLSQLYDDRAENLSSVGIAIDLQILFSMYGVD